MNNNKPYITVIVPVYNVEKYLRRCIDSILAQTFADFELLLIDDGSTDRSGQICDEYALHDNRIHVFHKENGGVSSARNIGLDNAKGEWIAFIDSDDYIDKNYFEIPKEYSECDVIQKSAIYKAGKKEKVVDITRNIINNTNDFYKFYVCHRTNCLWDKLISLKIIGERRFNENITIGEDALFFFSIISEIKSYAFCPIGHYIYVVRTNSTLHSCDKVKRLKFLFENANTVHCIASKENLLLLGEHIVASYIVAICNYHKYFTKEQYIKFKELVSTVHLGNLYYTPFKLKIKLYLIKFLLYICKKKN